MPDEVREKFLGKTTETAPVIDTLALVRPPPPPPPVFFNSGAGLTGARGIQKF